MGIQRKIIYNSTVDVESPKAIAHVSFLGGARSLFTITDVGLQTKGSKRVRYPHIGAKKKSVAVGELDFVENEEVLHEDYDVSITQKKQDCDAEDGMDGRNLFGFKTPQRSRSSVKAKTPSKAPADDENVEADPLSAKRHSTKSRKLEATTPYRLASRMDNGEASDDSMDSDDSNDSSVDDAAETVSAVNRSTAQQLPSMAEEFFHAQSSKSVTSNHTMARLREDGVLDQSSLRDILASRKNQYSKGVKQLLEEHRSMFRTWMLQMCLGFNLILYGYGSKKNLMEEFRKSFCNYYHCVVINGFFPSITLKSILASICEDCLQISIQVNDIDEIISAIDDHLNAKEEVLFLFIHNIDGAMVRIPTVQTALSGLASLENVHVIASVDHINAPLMWSQSVVTKYKWLWYDATTFDPYFEEISYENSLMTQQSGTLALRSMLNVYKSLTPNAKNIFLLMTNYHIDHCSNQSYIGIPFQMLYQKCRESFLVNSDQTLRTQLTEFRDHKLIRSRKGVDGAEHIFLPSDSATLNDFLEQVKTLDS